MKMKNDLLLKIAQRGYIVGYAAKLNFATYDIVKKLPGIISFLSIVFGILGLACAWTEFTTKCISVAILILGIVSIYIERFTSNIDNYGELGKKNIDQLNKLRNLYSKVKLLDERSDYNSIESEYEQIEKEFNNSSQPDQILFSNWYAHFKFFCESDVSWMDEQIHFKLWKDKIPQTAKAFLYIIITLTFLYYCIVVPDLNQFFRVVFFIE